MGSVSQHCEVVCIASWNADLTSRVSRPPKKGETLSASAFSISPGGKGSNAAVAAARQGARTAVVARIGGDDFGRMGLDLWQQESIDARHVQVANGERSGTAQIFVYDDGDNSIAVYAGAGAGLAASHIESAQQTIVQSRVVMGSCEVPLPALQAAFSMARAAGVTTLLNPAPATRLSRELLSLVDWLTPNQSELHGLFASGPAQTDAEAATALLEMGCKAVVVTMGGDGCCLYRRNEPPFHLAAHPVQVVDTVGAGDTFTGALAASLARGLPEEAAVRVANAAAALAVTGAGAITAMPDQNRTQQLLDQAGQQSL